jgi:predicted DNA binding CopG/RHH family protein
MKTEYDLSKMKRVKNPYPKLLTRTVKLRISREAITFFKKMAEEKGVSYETLINFYLIDCAMSKKRLRPTWASKSPNKG